MGKSITVDGVEYVEKTSTEPSDKQIVVAQRGWVFVGDVTESEDDLVLVNTRNIRIWGTTKGLGELVAGPLSGTKHDDYGTVRIPKLTVVARINVNAGAWS